MKRSVALFFLFVILLNIVGYYLVFEGWKLHNAITWAYEKSESDARELVVTIPLNLPYATQEKDWETAEGQFEHQGEIYRIVKQKINLDAVIIVCVKDVETSRINNQLEDFASTFTDKPVDQKGVKSLPGFIKEYISHSVSVRNLTTGWSLAMEYTLPGPTGIPSFFPSIVHPPERIG